MHLLSILILFTFTQQEPPRADGMVNCTITRLSTKITLQCAQDENVILDIAPKEWPESWERVFKLGWNYAAMYQRGWQVTADGITTCTTERPAGATATNCNHLRAVKTPPLHVNGPCPFDVHRQPQSRRNCIVTP